MKNILIILSIFLLSCNANKKEETPLEAPTAPEEVNTIPTNDTILLVTMSFDEKKLIPVSYTHLRAHETG
jgi:hypothetical protein